MANAKPTLWNTELATHRRHNMTDFERLTGSVPAVVIDPNLMKISHVALHGSYREAGGQFLSVEQATERRLIEVIERGNHLHVFIKHRGVEVIVGPAEGLLKSLQ